MREIRSSILDELRRIAETYKSDYKIAQQREEAIQKDLQSMVSRSQIAGEAGIILHDLEGTAQTYSALRDNFLQRYMESIQQQSFPITEARVITAATPPEHKSEPRTLFVLAMAGIGGIVLGLGVGRLRDLSDRVFRTDDQVVASLELDCIGLLPKLATDTSQSRRSKPSAGTSEDAVVPRTIVRDDRLLWHVVNESFSPFTEAIRSIKLAADLAMTTKDMGKVIAVTSALPKEGKSMVAASLAELISNSGARTILVDGDLRNSSLTRLLAPQAKWGLLDVVGQAASLEEVIWKEESTKLNFIPGLTTIRFTHTIDVLNSEAVKEFFKALRKKYDYIIVDLSPLAPIVDVRATTHFVDAYVYVIEWGKTKFNVVERALAGARAVRQSILGVVLNKADLSALHRYDSYYGNSFYNKYYSHYGETSP
jgi:succinoglycan biosynthesis transport protein ExoP